jgi:ATP/ADP translocase
MLKFFKFASSCINTKNNDTWKETVKYATFTYLVSNSSKFVKALDICVLCFNVVSQYLELRAMDNVQKPTNSERYDSCFDSYLMYRMCTLKYIL